VGEQAIRRAVLRVPSIAWDGIFNRMLSLEDRLNHFAKSISMHSQMHRTVEELSFAFVVLLNQPLARVEAANRFERLWNETNEAASASLGTERAVSYIALLKDMDARWRHLKVLN
jgi:hypothetical protein